MIQLLDITGIFLIGLSIASMQDLTTRYIDNKLIIALILLSAFSSLILPVNFNQLIITIGLFIIFYVFNKFYPNDIGLADVFIIPLIVFFFLMFNPLSMIFGGLCMFLYFILNKIHPFFFNSERPAIFEISIMYFTAYLFETVLYLIQIPKP